MPRRGDTPAVTAAKALLESSGYVVLTEGSYRKAQERQRLAQAEAEWAARDKAESERWWRDEVFPELRFMTDRASALGGLAIQLGATPEQLSAIGCLEHKSMCKRPHADDPQREAESPRE